MKRLRFLSVIIFSTAFLITVMLIPPCFAKQDGKPSGDKFEWHSLVQIEKLAEIQQAKYGGTIYVYADAELSPGSGYCKNLQKSYLQRKYSFWAESDDGRLKFWFDYDYPDPVIIDCAPFQKYGVTDLNSYLLLEFDYYLQGLQTERNTTGGPLNPNEKTTEYINNMLEIIDNWRREWPVK
jgi:hypothetical protein